MATSAVVEVFDTRISDVWFDANMLHVRLTDSREVGVPVEWFPRLRDAAQPQKRNWRLIGQGIGIHWPEIDEDISLDTLLRHK